MASAPTPVLVIVDEGYFGHEALVDELGPGFHVSFAEGLEGALVAMPALDVPLILAPHALEPRTGAEVLGALADHRFDFVGLLMLDDDAVTPGGGVHVLIRRPLRPGQLVQDLVAAATLRGRLVASRATSLALSQDIGRLRDGLRHDLRGHLQSIIGLSSLLVELESPTRPPDDETLDFLRRILGSAERLNRYIDHVGDWLQASRRPLETTVVDLGELALEVVAEVRSKRNEPRDDLRLVPADPSALGARVPGDARSMLLALRSLIEHALETTGHAEVDVVPTSCGWALSVHDHAERVVPSAHRARAFNLFERAAGGTGVQLAVAAKVAERHGGAVSLTEHPKGGHLYQLELPRAGADQDEVARA